MKCDYVYNFYLHCIDVNLIWPPNTELWHILAVRTCDAVTLTYIPQIGLRDRDLLLAKCAY